MWEISSSPIVDLRTVQPVASRSTDYCVRIDKEIENDYVGVAEVRSECKILVGNHVGDLAIDIGMILKQLSVMWAVNPLNPELIPICYLLTLLRAHHFLHVSRIRVKSLTLRLLMSYIYLYIYGAPILDVSRSHKTTQHSR